MERCPVGIPSTLTLTALACLAQLASAAPPGTGTSEFVVPTSLGVSSNCAKSYGLGINDGDAMPLIVVGQGDWCTEGHPRPLRWTSGTGMLDLGTILGAAGGTAEAVSNDGTVVGWLSGGYWGAFVQPLGGLMQELPKMPGMTYAQADDISPNGQFIVGSSSSDTDGYAVRWDAASGSWQPRSISVWPIAVSDTGAVTGIVGVAGTTETRARVWTESGSVDLPGVDTWANGINAAGTIVVGYRLQEATCRRPPCGKYEVPMVWKLVAGTWVAQELIALDGVDSEAQAVADWNGVPIVVGYGYTKKDAIMRAVYWTADADGVFGAPTRLGGLDGSTKAYAFASYVNSRGQVAGYSGFPQSGPKRPSRVDAVIWQIP